ncbi:MAG: PAS domain S-box protein [Desulfobacterales bacterium]|nr:PAS domain S-box protein [Desulfobacterales bacterium]
MESNRNLIKFGIIISLFFLLTPIISANEKQKILVLHSYHKGFARTDNIMSGIDSVFSKKSPKTEICVEYMDTKQHYSKEYYSLLNSYYSQKYADTKPDLIICSDDNSTDFLFEHRNEIFPGVPVVFCGITDLDKSRIAGRWGYTGVTEEPDFMNTIETALKLHPLTKQIAVINDYTPSGLKLMKQFREIKPEFEKPESEKKIEFKELTDLTREELVKSLVAMPSETTIILLLSYHRDPEERISANREIAVISDNLDIPVYTVRDSVFGNGIVGGKVLRGSAQGETASETAIRILNGENPEEIPIVHKKPDTYMFDYIQMKKYNIKLSDLPEHSLLINAPPGLNILYSIINSPLAFYWHHEEIIWMIFGIILSFLLFLLLIARSASRHRKAENALRKSEKLLKNLVENIHQVFWVMTPEKMEYISPAFEKIWGLSRDSFYNDRRSFLNHIHPDDKERILEAYIAQDLSGGQNAINEEYRIIRPDGKVRWLWDRVFPIKRDGKTFFMGITEDITDREIAQVSLLQSELKYRTLYQQAAISFFLYDRQGNISDANSNALEMLGYSMEEIRRLKPGNIVHPEDFGNFRKSFENILKGKSVQIEARLIKKNRKIVVAEINGKLLGENLILGMCKDITALKEAEEELRQSEARFLILTESAPVGVFIIKGEKCLYVNPAVKEITGYEADEILSMNFRELIHPDMREQNDLAKQLQENSPVRIETRLITKNREAKWADLTGSLIDFEDDIVTLLMVVDISGTKRAEKEADISYERLEALAQEKELISQYNSAIIEAVSYGAGKLARTEDREECINDVMQYIGLSMDVSRVTVFENNSDYENRVFFSRIFEWVGPGTEPLIEKPKIQNQLYHKAFSRWMDMFSHGKMLHGCIKDFPKKEKSILELQQIRSVVCAPIFADNEWYGFISFEECRIERKWTPVEMNAIQAIANIIGHTIILEKELEFAKARIEDAHRAKNQFLNNMSSEFLTMLNPILGTAQVFKYAGNGFAGDHRHLFDTVYDRGENLLTMINDISDLSQIEQRKAGLEGNDFYLPRFIDKIVERMRIKSKEKGISFIYNPNHDLPPSVRGDENRLRQVLLNLLDNAVKFTDKGSVIFKVDCLSGKDRIFAKSFVPQVVSNMRFQVQDTGCGIPKERLEQIFEPFSNKNDNKGHQNEGTGLGLAISRKLVRMMGSELNVKSTDKGGTTFWFDVDLPEIEWKTKPGMSEQEIPCCKGNPHKILIADDNSHDRLALRDILVPLGFEVIEAVDGRDALDKASELYPGLVLLDMVMPDIDGFEAATRIRQIEELKDVPVVAVSEGESGGIRNACSASGCDDYLVKPVDINELMEVLQAHLELEWIYEDGV